MICPPSIIPSSGREVVRYAQTELPTQYGTANLVVYREIANGISDPHKEHVALIFGDGCQTEEGLHCRVHSECITSEVFGSLKCDCHEQLTGALETLASHQSGILLYLRQEGRGIGLGNKIRAYALQSQGVDTIEANHQLGFEADLRTYDIAAGMLHELNIHKVRLLTNNPDKVAGLEKYGIQVTERLPLEIAPNQHSQSYLHTKRKKCGHWLNLL
ncbi:MAG: GTP cyclohydrolase II [Myxococcales bacterium]|nr:GTP cyclohydrolase II [Myxococcales bacterium]